MLHSDSARASYVVATVKMIMMMQNKYLAWGESAHMTAVGNNEHMLTHATHAWHRSVDGVTDIGHICGQAVL